MRQVRHSSVRTIVRVAYLVHSQGDLARRALGIGQNMEQATLIAEAAIRDTALLQIDGPRSRVGGHMRTPLDWFGLSLMLAVLAAPGAALPAEKAANPDASSLAVGPGNEVSFEYTLFDDEGAQIQTNKGQAPLVYVRGRDQMIPGLEKALDGMHVGEEKDVKVLPEEGYGPIRKGAFQEVPKEAIPAEALKVGTPLRAEAPDGESRMARVSEVKDKTVVVDLNHPLAGKTLAFHVKVLDVKKAAQSPPAPSAGSQISPADDAKSGVLDKAAK